MARLALLLLVFACSSASQSRAECALRAVQQLPLDDPDQITIGDTRALISALHACKTPDAGLIEKPPF